MEKKPKSRWFIFKHKACNAIFTINSSDFNKTLLNDDLELHFQCLNCGKPVFSASRAEAINKLLQEYERYLKQSPDVVAEEFNTENFKNIPGLPAFLIE